ncbi:MAG: bifunctional nicotinamidase/pyrazinamidase [Lentisphaeria bacterium]|nr:bifunctional nicotinamidase/pyrazinamidase [Lentisphaeria bacterium]
MNALLLTDIQNDFCPGGALAVAAGDRVVAPANRLAAVWELVVATQDWHPANHGSFAANHPGHRPGEIVKLDGIDQILWPVHCVQGTPGAAFHPGLDLGPVAAVFHKGTDPLVDSYSAFFDNGHRRATGLGDYLRERQVRELAICGLATDYCVKYTALDALALGFAVTLVTDACRGVNLRPEDSAQALAELAARGARLATSAELLARP